MRTHLLRSSVSDSCTKITPAVRTSVESQRVYGCFLPAEGRGEERREGEREEKVKEGRLEGRCEKRREGERREGKVREPAGVRLFFACEKVREGAGRR